MAARPIDMSVLSEEEAARFEAEGRAAGVPEAVLDQLAELLAAPVATDRQVAS